MLQAKQDLLVMATQGGNEKAFHILYRLHNQSLLRFSFKICADKEIAVEAVQQAWIQISKKLRSLNDPRSFKSWLYRSVRWRTIDCLREQKKERQRFEEFDEKIHQPADEEIKFDSGNLMDAINRLADIERQMIHLFYLDELKLNEISSILEIPVGTVKSRLNRARKQLKDKFY